MGTYVVRTSDEEDSCCVYKQLFSSGEGQARERDRLSARHYCFSFSSFLPKGNLFIPSLNFQLASKINQPRDFSFLSLSLFLLTNYARTSETYVQ